MYTMVANVNQMISTLVNHAQFQIICPYKEIWTDGPYNASDAFKD